MERHTCYIYNKTIHYKIDMERHIYYIYFKPIHHQITMERHLYMHIYLAIALLDKYGAPCVHTYI